nr:hypothetical protein [Tanacetum cinerariifolium]
LFACAGPVAGPWRSGSSRAAIRPARAAASGGAGRGRRSLAGVVARKHLQNGTQVARPALGGHGDAGLVRERNQPRFIVLDERDIAHYQRGIDGVVEQAQAREGHPHHAAFVDEAIHLLGPLILKVIDYQRIGWAAGGATGAGLPVDVARVVAAGVGPGLLKLHA